MNEGLPSKILAIGMIDSIHFARWLSGMQGFEAEIHIFPSGPNRALHKKISNLVRSKPEQFKLFRSLAFMSLPIWLIDRPLKGLFRATILFFLLRSKSYEIVHFHEMQSGGYPLRFLTKKTFGIAKICYSPYGSDLFWFTRFPNHLKRIEKVLKLTDLIFPECERDSRLAIGAGFSGEVGPLMPAGGAFEFAPPKMIPPIERNKIALKGYGGTFGRGSLALKSLELVQNQLTNFEIHVFSVSRDVEKEIRKLSKKSALNLVAHRKFSLDTEQMRSLMMESRYFLALSESDGFPASLMEAMLCGAIPIQSDSACLPKNLVKINPESFLSKSKWIEAGKTLVQLDQDEARCQALSENFNKWATARQLSGEDFRTLMSNSYKSPEESR